MSLASVSGTGSSNPSPSASETLSPHQVEHWSQRGYVHALATDHQGGASSHRAVPFLFFTSLAHLAREVQIVGVPVPTGLCSPAWGHDPSIPMHSLKLSGLMSASITAN
jgi:hypothetical protein